MYRAQLESLFEQNSFTSSVVGNRSFMQAMRKLLEGMLAQCPDVVMAKL